MTLTSPPPDRLPAPSPDASALALAKKSRAEGVRLAQRLGAEERDARLLAFLRERLRHPELHFAERPGRLLGGSEASVLAFRLANAPEPFDRPLVLRSFRAAQCSDRAAIEAGIHDAARAAGVAAPACLLHETGRDVLGSAFLILEWLEGETLLGALAIEAIGARLRPRSAWHVLRQAPAVWNALPVHLADAALAVAQVDAEAVEEAVRARGGPPGFLTVDERLSRIRRRIAKVGLDEALGSALAWLDASRPPPPARRCLVHGDLAPTNFLVRDGRIVGLLDWSKALLAEPEAEIGFLRASLRTAVITGLGPSNRVFRRPLARIAHRATERYVAARPLDPDRIRWYEAMRVLSLLASNVKRRKPKRNRPHVLDPSGSAAAAVRELERLTGARPTIR